MTTLQQLSPASTSTSALIKAQVHESELKRTTGVVGDVEVSIVLTNQRLLVQPLDNKNVDSTLDSETAEEPLQETGDMSSPREIALSSLVKAKAHKTLFGKKKACPTMVVKNTEEVKFEIGFTQQHNTIYTPVQERDDFLRLINEYLKINDPLK